MMSTSIIVEEWRDLWSFKIDFILASFAYVFSLYNFLVLPNLIYTQGGLCFIAAYVLVVFVACLPLIIMELAVGQLTGRAPVQALLSVCPLFKGVGVAQILYSLLYTSYMAVLLGYLCWIVFYYGWAIGHGSSDWLPWLSCANQWNTESCEAINANVSSTLQYSPASPISQFYSNWITWGTAESITGISHIEWAPIASAGLVWLLVFAAVLAGVRWMGKVCYLTVLIPIGCVIALLVNVLVVRFELAEQLGISIWNATRWEQALEWQFWQVVFRQALYATGFGFGAFITLGSYNKRNNNLVFDAILISFMHLLLTALLTVTALLLIGYAASNEADGFITNDPEVYKLLTTSEPVNALHLLLAAAGTLGSWAFVWEMVLVVAVVFIILNYLYVLALNVLATLEDAFGEKASRCAPRFLLAASICAFGCAASLIHTTDIGKYTLELTIRYLDLLTPWAIIFFELLAIIWFYCGYMLGKDIRAMVAACCCWCYGFAAMIPLYFLPVVPIYVMACYKYGTLWAYDFMALLPSSITDWQYSEYIGWAIAVVPLLPIPLFMVYMVVKTCIRGPGTTKWQRFKYTIISPLRYEIIKPTPPPRYTATAPGYVLLPQAPLAEPEAYQDVYGEHHVVRVSNI